MKENYRLVNYMIEENEDAVPLLDYTDAEKADKLIDYLKSEHFDDFCDELDVSREDIISITIYLK